MEDWSISKSLGQCCGTGKTIQAGEEYFAALVDTEDGLQRRDFCLDYWQQNKPEVFCFWKSRMTNPDEKKQIFVDDDMLFAFFERLATETEPERLNFRFVLALILMRKRKLKYDSSRNENGKEIWRLRVVGSNEFVDVVNTHLDSEQIEQLRDYAGKGMELGEEGSDTAHTGD